MNTNRTIGIALAATLALSAATNAQEGSPYAIGEWQMSGISGGTTDMVEVPAMALEYDVSLGSGGVTFRTAEYSAVAAGTGTVSFDYFWNAFHSYAAPDAQLQVFADTAAGRVVTDLVPLQATWAGFQFTGSASIDVEEGMTFGIIVGGSNFDRTSIVRGTVHVANLSGPCNGNVTFESPYLPQNWSTGGISGGTTDITETTALQFSYDVDLGHPGPGVSFRTADFNVPGAGDGNARFGWVYSGFHAYASCQAVLQLTSNGTTTDLLPLQSTWAGFKHDGYSGGFAVENGADITLTVGGSNFDAISRLRGTVTLIDFGAPIADPPACQAIDLAGPIGTIDSLDLLAFLAEWFPASANGTCP